MLIRPILITTAFLLSIPSISFAAEITAASCSQDDVQAAVNSANDGDTVFIPAGSCTWTTRSGGTSRCSSAPVCINNKNITLAGAGIDKTIISDETGVAWNNDALYINVATKPFRITGFTMTGGGAKPSAISIRKETNQSNPTRDWRIDHMKFNFTTAALAIGVFNNTYGVIDHNIFLSGAGTTQGVVVSPYSDGGETYAGDIRWNSDPGYGSADAVFIEDNTYEYGAVSSNVVDSNGGARIVFRHNTVKNTNAANHSPGQATGRGTQLMEIYGNEFIASNPQWIAIRLRSGTAVVYDNTMTGTYTSPGIMLDNPRTVCGDPNACNGKPPISNRCDGTQSIDGNTEGMKGYPCLDQIGYGYGAPQSQVAMPLYEWNNIRNGEPVHFAIHTSGNTSPPSQTDHIQEGRDYFNSTQKPNYIAYTYPHPLVSGEVPTQPDTPAEEPPPNEEPEESQPAVVNPPTQSEPSQTYTAPSQNQSQSQTQQQETYETNVQVNTQTPIPTYTNPPISRSSFIKNPQTQIPRNPLPEQGLDPLPQSDDSPFVFSERKSFWQMIIEFFSNYITTFKMRITELGWYL